MRLPKFEILEPGTVQEACSILKEHGDGAMALAGGTDVLIALKYRRKAPRFLVNLQAIPGLDYISYSQDGLRLGPLVRLRDIYKSPIVQQHYPILAQAASQAGSPPHQTMGTLGGNLCLDTRCMYYNQTAFWRSGIETCLKDGGEVCHVVKKSDKCWATYCADLAPSFIALGARAKLAGPQGKRAIPLEDLYTGDGLRPNILEAGQLLAEVLVPPPGPRSGGAYLKLRRRGAIDFPLLGVAVALRLGGKDGVIEDARVAMTAVDPSPVVVAEAAGLKGKALTEEALAPVLEAAYKRARPQNDMVGPSPHYRKTMVRVLVRRGIQAALEAARR